MPFQIHPGPFPPWCANMAYAPRTPPNFRADLHHDVRDHMLHLRLSTLAVWGGIAAQAYVAAARLLAITDDPVADCLMADARYDARTLWVAHDLMAAHWRHAHLPAGLRPGGMDPLEPSAIPTYAGLMAAFQRWLLCQTRAWCHDKPHLVRLMCLAMVREYTPRGRETGADLHFALHALYPLPADA